MTGLMGEFDATRQNDPAYWAAAVVVADQAGDADRARMAREQLQRLGYRLEPAARRDKHDRRRRKMMEAT